MQKVQSKTVVVDLYLLVFEISLLIADSCYTQWESPNRSNPICRKLDDLLINYSQTDLDFGDNPNRRIVAAGLFRDGDSASGFPGVVPLLMKMLEEGTVSVRSKLNDLPVTKISDVSASLKIWVMSPEDAGKVRAHILPEKLRAKIKDKAEIGRYTLDDAANLILEELDIFLGEEILDKLKAASFSGVLPVYWPGKRDRYVYGPRIKIQIREYFEEAYWNDLNKWLEKDEPSIKFRFPQPEGLIANEVTETTVQPSGRVRVGWQEALIEAWSKICIKYGSAPTAAEAIKWLKENDSSGYILGKNTGSGLFWKTKRGGVREVEYKTVANVISKWRVNRQLPKS